MKTLLRKTLSKIFINRIHIIFNVFRARKSRTTLQPINAITQIKNAKYSNINFTWFILHYIKMRIKWEATSYINVLTLWFSSCLEFSIINVQDFSSFFPLSFFAFLKFGFWLAPSGVILRCDILLIRYENGFLPYSVISRYGRRIILTEKRILKFSCRCGGIFDGREMLKMIRLSVTRTKKRQTQRGKFCNCNYIIYYKILIFIHSESFEPLQCLS